MSEIDRARKLLGQAREAGLEIRLKSGGIFVKTPNKDSLKEWMPVLRENRHLFQAAMLAEHASKIAAALSHVLSPDQVKREAMASAGALARNSCCLWSALRVAMQDESLPDLNEPVDRLPYGLPTWCVLPNGLVFRQGRYQLRGRCRGG